MLILRHCTALRLGNLFLLEKKRKLPNVCCHELRFVLYREING